MIKNFFLFLLKMRLKLNRYLRHRSKKFVWTTCCHMLPQPMMVSLFCLERPRHLHMGYKMLGIQLQLIVEAPNAVILLKIS